MNKKIMGIIVICICMFTLSIASYSSIEYVVDQKEYTYEGKDVTINLNDKKLECDIPPIIHNESTLLPIRALIEQLGGNVEWDGILQMVTVSLDKTEVVMIIGKNEAMVNGEKQILDVAPCLAYENGDTNTSRTIVPVRFVMENLGLDVNWDQDTFTVSISQKEQTDPEDTEQKPIDPEPVDPEPVDPDTDPEVIDPEPSGDVEDEKNSIRVGVYYNSSAKNKITVTAKTAISIGTVDDEEFDEKQVAKKNATIVLEPSGKYIKVTVNGENIGKWKGNIKLIPQKNSAGERMLTVNGLQYRGSAEISLEGSKLKYINILDMQEYLCSVVPSEMPASFGLEAVKAQAVAARTYALSQINRHKSDGFNLCSTTHCQVYSGTRNENNITNQAVEETENMVVRYEGELISTYYSASMGGYTEDVKNVWGSSVPYLKSVKDPYEPKLTPGSIYFTKAEIETKLKNKNINIGEVVKIEVTEYTKAGRALELVITGTKGKTTFLREGTRTFFNLKGQMYTLEGGAGILGLAKQIEEYAEVTEEKNTFVKVTTASLNVREKPDADAEKIGAVTKGEKFDILDEQDDWIKIEFENEDKEQIKGWISKEYVKEIEEVNKTTIGKIAKVTANEMNVRKKASTSSDIITTVGKNEAYIIIGQKGNWVNVIVGEQEAWLSKDYVEILEYDLDKVTNIQKQLINDDITFRIFITVYDNGHGVGMSQWGAKGMADEGFNYIEILQFYFTGVDVEEM